MHCRKINWLIIFRFVSYMLFSGKNLPSSKESIPFIIEWVPEIFRISKLGELTIRFEFYKSDPAKESGREISQSHSGIT